MDLRNLLSRWRFNPVGSASDFAGVAGTTNPTPAFAVSVQLSPAVDRSPAKYVAAKPACAVQGLCPPDHEMTSLGEVFAGVANDLSLPPGIGFQVVVQGRERELRPGLRQEVYCIGREAIINAYRHSRARRIEAEIEYRSTGLRIAVRDDGCGIDPQELQWGRNGHWGLSGMRDRAERIGAQLRLWSKVAIGTEVELHVPTRVAFEQ